jgi:hypothetical protein
MATTAQQLMDRTRRFLRDWPDLDTITASVTSTATTVVVADTTKYAVNQPIEIDSETMIVRALASGTNLTVKRGAYASTNTSHASSAAVLIKPQFFSVEILDALNYGLDMTFPWLYKEVDDISLSLLANTYEYTIPSSTGSQALARVARIELKEPGDLAYRPLKAWEVLRGTTSVIKFRRLYTTGSVIRVHGYGPFPHFTATTDSVDALYPYHAEMPLVEFAGSYLLESGEARRVRVDTGPVDVRENANRTGSSMSVSNAVLARFERNLARCAMPPLPRTAVAVM